MYLAKDIREFILFVLCIIITVIVAVENEQCIRKWYATHMVPIDSIDQYYTIPVCIVSAWVCVDRLFTKWFFHLNEIKNASSPLSLYVCRNNTNIKVHYQQRNNNNDKCNSKKHAIAQWNESGKPEGTLLEKIMCECREKNSNTHTHHTMGNFC